MKDLRLLELGNRIRFERIKNEITQEQLAEMANISIRTISDIERGITDIRYTNLLQIAEALKITISELLDINVIK